MRAIDKKLSGRRGFHGNSYSQYGCVRGTQLVQAEGRHAGKLKFPWSYGVVLANVTRKQFDDSELHRALEPQRVICQDEMLDSADPEDLQSRLSAMCPYQSNQQKESLPHARNHLPPLQQGLQDRRSGICRHPQAGARWRV